jgi:2-haloacid dehalogenase
MATIPSVIVFDVNETLSDLAPMADRFAEIGAPPQLARLWFATVLRDGFALTAAGRSERFSLIGEQALDTLFADVPLDRGLDAAVEHVLSGFTSIPPHPDVPAGVRALRAAGLRLVTLTNGSTDIAETSLDTAGLGGEFEALLSVDEARRRPAPGNPPAPRTTTPPAAAEPRRNGCCSWRHIPGTSTAPPAPA